jgi:hypothetical protein
MQPEPTKEFKQLLELASANYNIIRTQLAIMEIIARMMGAIGGAPMYVIYPDNAGAPKVDHEEE